MSEIYIYINRCGLLIDKNHLLSAISPHDYRELLKNLTLEHKNRVKNIEFKKIMRLYKFVESSGVVYMCFPKFNQIWEFLKSRNIAYKFLYKIRAPVLLDAYAQDGIQLEDYQEKCVEHLKNKFYNPETLRNGKASCTFVMDTGLGKSFVALAMIKHIRTRALIILPNKANLTDWIGYIEDIFPDVTIGQYTADVKEFGDIIITTKQSAIADTFIFDRTDYSNKYLDYLRADNDSITAEQFCGLIGFVIMDEIHDYCTDSYQEIFWRYNLYAVLGITATPDERGDNMDIIFHKHIGPLVRAINVPGVSFETVQWKCDVHRVNYAGPPEFTQTQISSIGSMSYVDTIKMITRDPDRNKLVVRLLHEQLLLRHNTFVFAAHKDFLHAVHNAFIAEYPQYSGFCGFMTGDSSDTEQFETRSNAVIIFTTYGYSKQSVNIPRMDAIIFGQPQVAKMRQIIGRILRISGDQSVTRKIFDIVDTNTGLAKQYPKRLLIYREKEFNIVDEPEPRSRKGGGRPRKK